MPNTTAHLAVAEWRAITGRTVSFAKVAKDHGAKRADTFAAKVYVFPDGSEAHTTGAGPNHRITINGERV